MSRKPIEAGGRQVYGGKHKRRKGVKLELNGTYRSRVPRNLAEMNTTSISIPSSAANSISFL